MYVHIYSDVALPSRNSIRSDIIMPPAERAYLRLAGFSSMALSTSSRSALRLPPTNPNPSPGLHAWALGSTEEIGAIPCWETPARLA